MISRLAWLFVLVAWSSTPGLGYGESPPSNASPELDALIAEIWEARLREWPQFATSIGDRRFNDQLASVSLADSERWAKVTRDFRKRLRAIDRGALDKQDQIERDLLDLSLSDSLTEHEAGDGLMPINGQFGFHVDFPELPEQVPLDSIEDFDNYLSRLRGFAEYVDGHIELMREGIRRGVTVPAVTLEGFEDSLTAHAVEDPTTSLLYKPFENLPKGFADMEQERLRAEGKRAVAESVAPAYRRFLEFMTEEYVPNCRATIAASALPGGREYYRHRVRKYTTLDISPDEVHQIGLSEVKRIRAEMDELIERVGFEGDFAAFVEHLRTDTKFYDPDEEALMARTAAILKRADGELPKLFGRLPRMPYGLKPVPDYIAAKAPAAYYQRPKGDGTRAGFFYLNTYELPSRPVYTLEALALHEAVPGHHLQIALQQELTDLSPLRRYGGFTAFSEGWALYAERLGLEMGFYEDPYSDFGRLTMEIWRAARLVVDTGMHYRGWSRERAIEFMASNSAMSDHNIRSEVDRYIGWPGQALAYKTGELKIRELRQRAEEQLEEKFDVRRFHDTVLANGAVPLTVLENLVDDWISEEMSR